MHLPTETIYGYHMILGQWLQTVNKEIKATRRNAAHNVMENFIIYTDCIKRIMVQTACSKSLCTVGR
jgi:hypothetical protein